MRVTIARTTAPRSSCCRRINAPHDADDALAHLGREDRHQATLVNVGEGTFVKAAGVNAPFLHQMIDDEVDELDLGGREGSGRQDVAEGSHAHGRFGERFRNAWQLTLSRQLEYWEGWAWDPKIGALPFYHAWCVDSVDRAVVDPTWAGPEKCVYFGLHIPTDVLLEALNETAKWGVLDIGDGTTAVTVTEYLGRVRQAHRSDLTQRLEPARRG